MAVRCERVAASEADASFWGKGEPSYRMFVFGRGCDQTVPGSGSASSSEFALQLRDDRRELGEAGDLVVGLSFD